MESIRFQALREEKSPSFRLHVRRLNPLVHSFPPSRDRMDRRFSSAICSQKIIVPSIIKMSEFLSLAGRARTRFADDSTRFQCVRWPRARPRAARRMAGGLRPPSLIRALHARCVKPLPGKAILTSVRCSCAVDRGASEFAQIAISAQGFAAGANRFGVLERDSPSKMLDLERTSRFGNEKSPFNNRIGEIRESSALNAPLFPCRNRSERMQDPRKRRRSRATGNQDRGEEKRSFCTQGSLEEEKSRCIP